MENLNRRKTDTVLGGGQPPSRVSWKTNSDEKYIYNNSKIFLLLAIKTLGLL